MARLSRIGLQRLGELALRHQHVADLVVRDRQIALPAGIAGVGLGQALGDGEAVAEGFQRLGEIALRHQHVADLVIGDREIALPAGIARVGRARRSMMARLS